MARTSNRSQHTKLTLEKKILPPLLPGFELATFRSRVRHYYYYQLLLLLLLLLRRKLLFDNAEADDVHDDDDNGLWCFTVAEYRQQTNSKRTSTSSLYWLLRNKLGRYINCASCTLS